MTALDPALCARLVAEAREDDRNMTRTPWSHDDMSGEMFGDLNHDERPVVVAQLEGESLAWDARGIARTRNNLRAMADQLEAALAEVAGLSRDGARLRADLSEVQDHHDTQRDRAQKLAAEVVILRSDLAYATSVLKQNACDLGDLR